MNYDSKYYLVRSPNFSLKIVPMKKAFGRLVIDKDFYEDFTDRSLPEGYTSAFQLSEGDYLFYKRDVYIVNCITDQALELFDFDGNIKLITNGHWIFNPANRTLVSENSRMSFV